MNIKGEHEDLIYKNREFIQELIKVQDLYFDTLFAELKDDGFCDNFQSEASAEDWLFDYVYNCSDPISFEEYLPEK